MVEKISSTLTITIRKQDDDYTIEASGPKGIKVEPQPATQLKALLFDQQITDTLKALSSPTAPATTDQIQKFGKALYNSLFPTQDFLIALGKVQGSASTVNGVRLRLQIEPAELEALPWETLHDGKDWLSIQSTMPLTRKLALSENRKPLRKLQVRGALRILFVGASPDGLDNLEIEKTADELETLLDKPIKKKQITFNKLLNASLEDLQRESVKDYHILYFAGHGSPEGIFLDDAQGDDIEQEGKVIGRERGDKSLISAETLAQTLKEKQTRLVFLAACETSKASKTSEESRLLSGFAQELAERSNLPAIVAMQYFISDRQSLPLTTQFFAALAAGRPVDMAMAEARSVLVKKGQVNRDVFSPVLYLQADDGSLFPKAKNWPAISLSIALLIAMTIGGSFYRTATINRIDGLIAESQKSLESNRIPEARIESIRAAKNLQQSIWRFSWPKDLINAVIYQLIETAYGGKELYRLETNHGGTYDIAFSPDGQQIATCGEDGNVMFWDIYGNPLLDTSGKPRVLDDGQSAIGHIAFSPDGKKVVTGDASGNVKLWDISGNLLVEFKGHTSLIDGISFSPDGQKIVTYSWDRTVRLWDISGKSLGEFKEYDGIGSSVDEKQFLIFKRSGHIWLGNYNSWKLLPKFPFKANTGNLEAVALSPDGQQIATSTSSVSGGDLQIWDLAGNLISQFDQQEGSNKIAFSPDGKYLVTSGNSKVSLWGIPNKYTHKLDFDRSDSNGSYFIPLVEFDSFHYGKFSPDSKQLVMIENKDTVRFWSAANYDSTNVVAARQDGVNQPWYLVAEQLSIIDQDKLSVLPDQHRFRSISLSPDGQQLVTGGDDGTVSLWDISGKLAREFDAGQGIIGAISFSPDGQQLATGGEYDTIKLWSISGKRLKEFNAQQGGVWGIAFSPDNKKVASVGLDKTLRLWDISGNLLSEINTNQVGNINMNVTFSPDGTQIITGKGDTARLWQIGGLYELLSINCDWVRDYLNNALNVTERERYLCDGVSSQK